MVKNAYSAMQIFSLDMSLQEQVYVFISVYISLEIGFSPIVLGSTIGPILIFLFQYFPVLSPMLSINFSHNIYFVLFI